MKSIIRSLRSKSGQGMTEYVIVICVVAIAALLVIGVFGTNVRNLFSTANTSLQSGNVTNAQSQKDGASGNVTIKDLQGK